MRRLIFSLAVLAFFVNPGIACTSSDDGTFQFGEPEMRAAVEGQWRLDWSVSGGGSATVTVQISEGGEKWDSGASVMHPVGRGFIRSAAACDSRNFVKSAGACMDVSAMPLQVAYVSGDSSYQSIPIGGRFNVYGLSFRTGYMEIVLGTSSLQIGVRPDGTVDHASGLSPDGQLTVVAQRVSP